MRYTEESIPESMIELRLNEIKSELTSKINEASSFEDLKNAVKGWGETFFRHTIYPINLSSPYWQLFNSQDPITTGLYNIVKSVVYAYDKDQGRVNNDATTVGDLLMIPDPYWERARNLGPKKRERLNLMLEPYRNDKRPA